MTETKSIPLGRDEASFVDLAYEILQETKQPFYFHDLINELAKMKSLSEEQMQALVPRIYTDINIDGRFTCVGENLWGLRKWYPLDSTEDDLLSIEAYSPEEEEELEEDYELELVPEAVDEEEILPEDEAELDDAELDVDDDEEFLDEAFDDEEEDEIGR